MRVAGLARGNTVLLGTGMLRLFHYSRNLSVPEHTAKPLFPIGTTDSMGYDLANSNILRINYIAPKVIRRVIASTWPPSCSVQTYCGAGSSSSA